MIKDNDDMNRNLYRIDNIENIGKIEFGGIDDCHVSTIEHYGRGYSTIQRK